MCGTVVSTAKGEEKKKKRSKRRGERRSSPNYGGDRAGAIEA
jgi:hypothetical protein